MEQRMEKLRRMLERTPADPFLLYAMGMEFKKAGNWQSAIDYFDKTLAVDPAYCYAYHQMGLAYELGGDVESAKRSYNQGIAAARSKGDEHAAQEIAEALAAVE